MASIRKTHSKTIYHLDLSSEEAAALCELLCAASSSTSAGRALDGVYDALTGAGAEEDEYAHDVKDGQVFVYDPEEDDL